mmetsp:Transcript_24216/g.43046  ORF Transcript_24216/g.43046 Transcript_24216/m.43046 type:complete len:208 (-) Transcript_24216:2630-3253(-)
MKGSPLPKDAPLCLLKQRHKRTHALKLPKRRPIEISKYKAASLPKLFNGVRDLNSTTVASAVEVGKLSMTLRAYYEVANKKNSIKPDHIANSAIGPEVIDQPNLPEALPVPQSKLALQEEGNGAIDYEEEVFCNCNLPYKAGELMFKCEGFCDNWYHPACVNMSVGEIERQKNTSERWYCPVCYKQAYDIMVTCSTQKRENKRIKFK